MDNGRAIVVMGVSGCGKTSVAEGLAASLGYSFLEENTAKLKGVPIDGAEATYDNISSGKYKGARPLFVYVKKQHVGVIPGIDKFVAEYVSNKALSKDGYLARKGLVALPKGEIDKVMAGAKEMKVLSASDVH